MNHPITVYQQYINSLFVQGRLIVGEFMFKAYYCIKIYPNVYLHLRLQGGDWSPSEVKNAGYTVAQCQAWYHLFK